MYQLLLRSHREHLLVALGILVCLSFQDQLISFQLVRICSSIEVETPTFARIQDSSLILMSPFESILLVGRFCFTQGLVPGVLIVPIIFYVFLRNYLLINQICDLNTTH